MDSNHSIIKRLGEQLYCNGKRFSSVYGWKELERWKKLRNNYKGKRVFLIANGPSLNMTPLYLLKDEYTIVFNRFKLMLERLNYQPSFYMIMDNKVILDNTDVIAEFTEKSELAFVPDILKAERVSVRDLLPKRDNLMYLFQEPMKFSNNLPFFKIGNSVTFGAYQILRYLGFSEVFVVGNDMNYVVHQTADVVKNVKFEGGVVQDIKSTKDDDPNHFDPRYFGKGQTYHQPTAFVTDRMFKNLDLVAKEYKKSGVKIVNAGYNSMVQSFPKQDFYEALGYSREKIDELFDDLVRSKGLESKEWLFEKAVLKEDVWDEELNVAVVPMEMATAVVKKKVLDYLPLGPYRDKLYFVNRKLIKL